TYAGTSGTSVYGGVGVELENQSLDTDEDFDPNYGPSQIAGRTTTMLAATLAALDVQIAQTLRFQDEITQTPTPIVDEIYTLVARATDAYKVPTVLVDTDDITTTVVTTLDDNITPAMTTMVMPPRVVMALDPEEIPAGFLHGQPDEDFWVSGVMPVAAALFRGMPIGDPEEVPAGFLHGQPDED